MDCSQCKPNNTNVQSSSQDEQQRSSAIVAISQMVPSLNNIHLPSTCFTTQYLIKLADILKYHIPIHYIPQHYQKAIANLTQYCLQNQHLSISSIHQQYHLTNLSMDHQHGIHLKSQPQPQSQQRHLPSPTITPTTYLQYKNSITNQYPSILQYVQAFHQLPNQMQIDLISPSLFHSIQMINSWPKTIQTTQLFHNAKNKNKKASKSSGKEGESDTDTSSSLILGVNEHQQTKKLRDELKIRAQNNFTKIRDDKQLSMNQRQKAQTNMHFQLNKVSLDNIDEIFEELKPYVAQHIRSQQSSLILIDKIIEKCQNQHYRYIATYAKLCQKLSTIAKDNFQNQEVSPRLKQNKGNLFKKLLVKTLQQQFDKHVKAQHNYVQKQAIKFYKYQFVGCMMFIAELIKLKVLSEKIINVCLATIILAALECIKNQKYSLTSFYKKGNEQYIEVYLESIIKFIETLGVNYNCIVINPQYNQRNLKQKLKSILASPQPNYDQQSLFYQLCVANSEGYLSILELVNESSQKQYRQSSRIDLLIMNIIQNFNYALIQERSEEQEDQTYSQSINKEDQLNKIASQIKQILSYCNNSAIEESILAIRNTMQDSNHKDQKVRSFLRLIADAKQQEVIMRLKVFKRALESFDSPQQWLQSFKNAWFNDFKYLSTLGSDLKYLTQVLAQLLRLAIDSERVSLKQYQIDCDDEDELQFMNEITSKFCQFQNIQ